MATRLKRGNVFAHAKAIGKKLVLRAKKAATKKAAPKKRVPKKRIVVVRKKIVRKVTPKRQVKQRCYRYYLEVKKTSKGSWSSMNIGSNSISILGQIAKAYASRYPSYAFRVMK